jgi:hypothetical protein
MIEIEIYPKIHQKMQDQKVVKEIKKVKLNFMIIQVNLTIHF